MTKRLLTLAPLAAIVYIVVCAPPQRADGRASGRVDAVDPVPAEPPGHSEPGPPVWQPSDNHCDSDPPDCERPRDADDCAYCCPGPATCCECCSHVPSSRRELCKAFCDDIHGDDCSST